MNWATGDLAIFGAGSDGTYEITLGGDVTTGNGSYDGTGGLDFANSGYTLSAASAQAVTVGTAAADAFVKVASGKTATIGNNVTVKKGNSGGYVLLGGGTLEVASGGAFLQTYGNASQVADGTTLWINGGSASYGGSFVVGAFNAAYGLSGSVTVDSGSLTVGGSGNLIVGRTAGDVSNLALNDGSVTASGGELRTDDGTATIALNGGILTTKRIRRAGGTMKITAYGGTIKAASGANADFIASSISSFKIDGGGLTIDDSGQTLSVSAALLAGTGSGGLTKIGSGNLTLTGANTYTGDTTIINGNLFLNTTGDEAISGNVKLDSTGGSGRPLLFLNQSNQIASTATLTMQLNAGGAGGNIYADFALQGNSQTLADLNPIWDTGVGSSSTIFIENRIFGDTAGTGENGILTINNSSDRTWGSRVRVRDGGSGTLSLVKDGGGTLTLGGTNEYTGSTTVNGGTLEVTSTLGGGTSAGNILIGTGGNLSINSSSSQTLSGAISGDGALSKAGSGTLTLSGSGSSYNGTTTISGGILAVADSSAFDTGAAISVASGATLRVAAATAGSGTTLTINGTGASFFGALQGASSSSVTWAGDVVLGSDQARIGGGDSGTLAVDGVISDGGNGYSIIFSRAPNSTTVLNGVNTYTGDTQLFPNTSTVNLKMGVANAIDSSSRITFSSPVSGTANIDLNGFSQNVRALVDTYTADMIVTNEGSTDAVLTLSESNAANSATFDGWIQDGTTNKISLVKTGAGTQILAGTNTYSGTTTVSGGTLVINGSISTSVTTVESGGTLAGSGTVGAVVVEGGGTLSPGNSPGTLTVDGGSLQLGVGGNLNWQVYDVDGAAGTGYDTVNLTNAATLDLSLLSAVNQYNINLWSLSGLGPDVNGDAINFDNTQSYSWTLFSTGTAISGFDASYFNILVGANNGTAGFSNDLGGGTFSVGLADSDTDLVLNFTPVPEPRAALLGSLGMLMLLRRRRD